MMIGGKDGTNAIIVEGEMYLGFGLFDFWEIVLLVRLSYVAE